jgi:hypothetical protein
MNIKNQSPLDIIIDGVFDLFNGAFGKGSKNKPPQYFLYGLMFIFIALVINYFFSTFLAMFSSQENINSSLDNILSLVKIVTWIINAILIGSGLICFYKGFKINK